MKHFVLFLLVSFFIVFNIDVNAKVEQSLNEYKIEQLQKGIDDLKKEIEELKKDVDDTKEKKIENKAVHESLDKRIGDINGNVDRFGIIAAILSSLITVVILSLGYFAYKGARTDAKIEAKKEAEDTTKNWLEKDGKERLNEIIQKLQTISEEEFSQLVKEKTDELYTLFEDFKQEHKEQLHNHENEFKQKMKEHYTVEEKEEINKDAKISQEKEIKTFEDYWNIILQHYTNKEFDKILSVAEEAKKLDNLIDTQKVQLYLVKGFIYQNKKEYEKAEKYYLQAIEKGNKDALNNLGNLYKEQKEYEKAEKYYLQAIEKGNNDTLFNLGLLYYEQEEYEKAEKYYLQAIEKGNYGALNNLGNLYKEEEEYEKAEKYYLQAIEKGNDSALNNLGNLYKKQEEYKKAEKYYLQAIEKGNNDTLFNLGLLYYEQKEYEKAKKYYLQAIKNGHNGALNNLAYMYFSQSNNKEQALKFIQESYEKNKFYINTHTFATILLWNEEFTKSYEKFEEWMEYEGALENLNDISEYLNLLIAKGQYYKAKEYFENEKYQLKDKLKPIWYALMTLMQDEFPNEIKKMGSELQTSVDDILKTIEELKQKYKI